MLTRARVQGQPWIPDLASVPVPAGQLGGWFRITRDRPCWVRASRTALPTPI